MYSAFIKSAKLMETSINYLLTPLENVKLGIGYDDPEFKLLHQDYDKIGNFHLQVSLPYAKQRIRLEMCFNPLYPELGPDIICEDEEYLQNETPASLTSNLPSLVEWDFAKKLSLLNVVKELFSFYKKYQINLLKKKSDKLTKEYEMLIKEVRNENLEVAITQELDHVEIKFLIKIYINLPEALHKLVGSSSASAFILIHFSSPHCNGTPELYVPELQNSLEGLEISRIPPNKEKFLIDYVVEIRKYLTDKVTVIAEHFKARKSFTSAICAHYQDLVVECDIILFKQIALINRTNDFDYMIVISLPTNFPDEKFSLTFRSMFYENDQKEPVIKKLNNFQYSPNWQPKEMVEKAFDYISKEVKKFQEYCIKHGKYKQTHALENYKFKIEEK